VQEVRDQGYLPEAVRNYIALLGWGYDESTTFMTTDELVERFSLDRVSKNPAVFDEQKLRWMNGRYMRELPLEILHERLEEFLGREVPRDIVAISQEKMQTLADFEQLAGTLVDAPTAYDDKAWRQWGESPYLRDIRDALANGDTWEVEEIEAVLRALVDDRGVKPKEIFQPIRVALTGTTVSPGIFESLWALGREESLTRLDKALSKAE
jgi:glutamyl-tRNA synthetase